jgi:hypothetical protein
LKKAGEANRAWRHTFMKQQFESFVKPFVKILSTLVNENSRFSLSFIFKFWFNPGSKDLEGASVFITAGMKLPSFFLALSSFVAIATRSRSHEKLSSGTQSFLTGYLGGSGWGGSLLSSYAFTSS